MHIRMTFKKLAIPSADKYMWSSYTVTENANDAATLDTGCLLFFQNRVKHMLIR